MKYMLLIHQGSTPQPGTAEWESLSADEQSAVYADYQAINEKPGVTTGLWLQPPESATTVQVQEGKTLTTDGPFVAIKEALGGYGGGGIHYFCHIQAFGQKTYTPVDFTQALFSINIVGILRTVAIAGSP